jgi:peptidoglycan/xylan/chitin deacetylase (PgdA/CDA1 family)
MVAIIPTIDVEGVHGERPFEQFVLGDVGSDEDWGVFKIARLFEEFGVKGTFFVDVYEHTLWGEKAVRRVCERLLEMGQDVQLHTHPSWRDDPYDFGFVREIKRRRSFLPQESDLMGKLSKEAQIEVLEYGIHLFERWLGTRPVAHRSGGYSINEDTVQALRIVGIPVDSSMNVSHPNSKITWSNNRVVFKNGVLEIPITVMKHELRFVLASYSMLKKTSLDSWSVENLRRYIELGKEVGPNMMNLFMHSYSLLKYDAFYRNIQPDQKKAEGLAALLKGLAEDPLANFFSCDSFYRKFLEGEIDCDDMTDDIPRVSYEGREVIRRCVKAVKYRVVDFVVSGRQGSQKDRHRIL